jgi:hypothetical protein
VKDQHAPTLALVETPPPRATIVQFIGYAPPFSTPEECAEGPGKHGPHRTCWLCSHTREAGAERWRYEMRPAS